VNTKCLVWWRSGEERRPANLVAVIQPVRPCRNIILCFTDVAIETGASVNVRYLSQTAVALQKATVTSDVGHVC
jgi:hypothetical protein